MGASGGGAGADSPQGGEAAVRPVSLKPPRVAEKEQDAGEITGPDRATGPLEQVRAREALKYSDGGTERPRAGAPLERHSRIEEHDDAGPPKAIAPADEIVIRDAVHAAAQAHR